MPVTVPVSDKTHYDAIARQLLACLDAPPDGLDRPQMKNGRDDDRLAAILVPLIWRDSDWQILMTKRAAHLSHHAGQISFPGGALDASDEGLIDTALREAHEEISLAPPSVRVMGSLLPVRSPAGFIVQPIVGMIGGDIFNELRPDPAEVDSIFTLPLAHIGQPDNFSLVPRQTEGRDNSYWVVSHPEHYIWGLSARVLNDLRQRLYHGQTLA
ncbi:MAG: CoA pyrophosphatase [Proteobacteria bacterium]|nr:CoA pyrophosphatase [Pseudomonadota bacterium]MDA0844606.1 CoA pyrophosphatase [Pseudomonadota bacterium]